MLRRIIVAVLLSFGVIPAIAPIIGGIIAGIFGHNIDSVGNQSYVHPHYEIAWGGFLFYCSIIVLIFVFGVYNFLQIYLFTKVKRRFGILTRVGVFFLLYTAMAYIHDLDCYTYGLYNTVNPPHWLILLEFAIISVVSVYPQYLIVDQHNREGT